ncbi:MAG: hypothetical protein ACI9FB_002055 [Candidatus Azotimanducaceae bacterium]|jgi:hypothetical protein
MPSIQLKLFAYRLTRTGQPDDPSRFILILFTGGLTVVNCFTPLEVLESTVDTSTILVR